MVKSRIKRIFRAAPEGLEAAVLFNSENPHLDLTFFYATDLVEGGLFEGGMAILRPDGSCTILTSELEEQSARKAKDAEVLVFHNRDERTTLLGKAVGGAGKVGFNARETTYANVMALREALPQTAWVDIGPAVLQARMVKDGTEVARIRKAARIGSKVAEEIPTMLREGMTEMALSAEMNARMQKHGASGPSFATIVAFGANAAEPHYAPSSAVKLRANDYVLCDFGALHDLYASDITRTYVFGKASKEQRRVYGIVREAQQVGFDLVKPGAACRDVHNAVAAVIDQTKYKGRFIHSTGHSLGLAVHDGGRIAAQSDQVLEEGMVFTVEPGIYVPGWGGVRIEDDVLVTRKGCELLTTARRELVEVPLPKPAPKAKAKPGARKAKAKR
ncbi:MAG TPA: Xaa-Pro peptidase family protein [Candidatus Thermoplasmatota archaeon]|jgi:Xaa-Pro dipeptidase|nr:Xaa-Pro peptidase family protein [Candidatus Thermoplasmatota archaeon]